MKWKKKQQQAHTQNAAIYLTDRKCEIDYSQAFAWILNQAMTCRDDFSLPLFTVIFFLFCSLSLCFFVVFFCLFSGVKTIHLHNKIMNSIKNEKKKKPMLMNVQHRTCLILAELWALLPVWIISVNNTW